MELRYEVFKVSGFALLVVGLFIASYAVAASPTRAGLRLGLRGLKRQRAISGGGLWPSIEPLVRWLGVRLSGVLTDEQRTKLDDQITLAGDVLGLTVDEYLALMVLSGAVGLGLGTFIGLQTNNLIAIVVMGAGGAMAPYLQVSGTATERLKGVARGLPYVIDLMALAMGAGQDFPGAVRQVVEKSSNPEDPIVEEFTLILQTLNIGRTRREALLEFQRRCPVDSVKEFTGALLQAEERGNPVADVLQIQAASSRMRRSVRAEELASKAGVAMIGPLLLVFVSVMILILGPIILTMMTMQ